MQIIFCGNQQHNTDTVSILSLSCVLPRIYIALDSIRQRFYSEICLDGNTWISPKLILEVLSCHNRSCLI